MSAKIAVLIILSFVGSAYLGFFLGGMYHENKTVNFNPNISQTIQQNQNPSGEVSSPTQKNNAPSAIAPSFQYGNGTQKNNAPSAIAPSFQYGNGTQKTINKT